MEVECRVVATRGREGRVGRLLHGYKVMSRWEGEALGATVQQGVAEDSSVLC